MREDALEALCNALDVIDDRLRRCEEASRVAWIAMEDQSKTARYLTEFRIALRKSTEQPTAEGDA